MANNAVVNILIRAKDMTGKAVNKARSGLTRLKRTFFSLQTAATALAAGALTRLGQKLFQLGTDAEEFRNRFRVVFGDLVAEMDRFVERWATMTGITRTRATDMLATMGGIAQAMGATREASADFSRQVFRLAADMASFNDVPMAQTLEAIQSGLAKQPRPLRQYMIFLTEANRQQKAMALSGKSLRSELTELDKAWGTLALIQEQAGVQLGDNIRTQDSAARAAKSLGAATTNVAQNFGELFRVLVQSRGAVTGARDEMDRLDRSMRENMAQLLAWGDVAARIITFVVKTFGALGSTAVDTIQLVTDGITGLWLSIRKRFQGGFRDLLGWINEHVVPALNKLPFVDVSPIDVSSLDLTQEQFDRRIAALDESIRENGQEIRDTWSGLWTDLEGIGVASAVAMDKELSEAMFGRALEGQSGPVALPDIDPTTGVDQVKEAAAELAQAFQRIDTLSEEGILTAQEALEQRVKAVGSALETFAEQGLQAEDALPGLDKTLGDLSEEYKILRDALAGASAEQERLNDLQEEAKEIIEDSLPPMQRFEQRQARLQEMRDRDLLSQEQYKRGLQEIRREMVLAGAATDSLAGIVGSAFVQMAASIETPREILMGFLRDFSGAISEAFTHMIQGSENAAAAFAESMQAAVASAANQLGQLFLAHAIAALGWSIIPPPFGNPAASAGAGHLFAAAGAMFALAGAVGAIGGESGISGSGGSARSSAVDTSRRQEEQQSEVIINVEGSPIWDLSDPRTFRRVQAMLEELSDRRVIVRTPGA